MTLMAFLLGASIFGIGIGVGSSLVRNTYDRILKDKD